jgi:antitoxin FitA
MIQIRNVPENLHRELKTRAARSGMSLSDYVLAILERAAERATPDEMRELLLRTPAAGAVEARLFAPGETLQAPHLIDLEVAQVVRRSRRAMPGWLRQPGTARECS